MIRNPTARMSAYEETVCAVKQRRRPGQLPRYHDRYLMRNEDAGSIPCIQTVPVVGDDAVNPEFSDQPLQRSVFSKDRREKTWELTDDLSCHRSVVAVLHGKTWEANKCELWKFLLQQIVRSHVSGNNNLRSLTRQFPNDRDATCCMTQAPIKRCNQDSFRSLRANTLFLSR